MAWKGECRGQRGSTDAKGPDEGWYEHQAPRESEVGGNGGGGAWTLLARRLASTFSSARHTSVRPHETAMRQSSRGGDPADTTLGRFSPVSNTSRAASQYVEAVGGSSGSARSASCAITVPMRNNAVPKMAWKAVGGSLC